MERQYDIFLSHNSKDKPLVRELAAALEKNGVSVWLDEREIYPGQYWQEIIESALESVRSVAVLISANGLGAWEMPEMRCALILAVDQKIPVIPIFLPGAPLDVQLPLFLRLFTWVDFRAGITTEGLLRIRAGVEKKQITAVNSSISFGNQEGENMMPLRLEDQILIKIGYFALRIIFIFVPSFLKDFFPALYEFPSIQKNFPTLQTLLVPNKSLNHDGPDRPAG